jgi:hypothetical protein
MRDESPWKLLSGNCVEGLRKAQANTNTRLLCYTIVVDIKVGVQFNMLRRFISILDYRVKWITMANALNIL